MGWFDFIATPLLGCLTFWILVSFLLRRRNLPPGPWGFPVFGAFPRIALGAYTTGWRRVFHDWHCRYGPIYSVKLGSANVVLLGNFEIIRDMLNHPQVQGRVEFDNAIVRKGEGILTSSGRIWLEQRRFLHQHFREFGIGKASFEDRVATEANFLTGALLDFEGRSLDLMSLLNTAAFNVIAAVAYDMRFDYDSEKIREMLRQFNDTMEASVIQYSLTTFLPFTKYLPIRRKCAGNLTAFFNFHEKMVDEHKGRLSEDNVRALIDAHLLETRDRIGSDMADVFNDDNMFWIIGDLLGAGTETTSTTLSWVFLFLLRHPDVEAKLRSQLDIVVGQNRLPRYSDRRSLPYLEAVISETLRLGTTNSFSLPHVTSADITFHGYNIPEGTIMIPNLNVLHNDSSKWKDPERFFPERFLDDEGKYIKREDFIPFSTGRRQCLGEQLARMTLFIFVSHIMQKMRFTAPEGSEIATMEGVEGFTYQTQPYEVSISKCEV